MKNTKMKHTKHTRTIKTHTTVREQGKDNTQKNIYKMQNLQNTACLTNNPTIRQSSVLLYNRVHFETRHRSGTTVGIIPSEICTGVFGLKLRKMLTLEKMNTQKKHKACTKHARNYKKTKPKNEACLTLTMYCSRSMCGSNTIRGGNTLVNPVPAMVSSCVLVRLISCSDGSNLSTERTSGRAVVRPFVCPSQKPNTDTNTNVTGRGGDRATAGQRGWLGRGGVVVTAVLFRTTHV